MRQVGPLHPFDIQLLEQLGPVKYGDLRVTHGEEGVRVDQTDFRVALTFVKSSLQLRFRKVAKLFECLSENGRPHGHSVAWIVLSRKVAHQESKKRMPCVHHLYIKDLIKH